MYIYKASFTGGMNTRPDHNVLNAANGAVAYNVPTECTEVWTAPADGSYVKAGDKWARLNSGIIKWVAIIHLGKVYGTIAEVGTPEPPAPVLYPESAVWEYVEPSTGQTKRIQYKFEKIVE